MKFMIVVLLLTLICLIFFLTKICQDVADINRNKFSFEDRYWLGYNLKCSNIFAGIAIAITLLYIFCG